MSNYPPERASAANSDEDGSEHAEEDEEDEAGEEEELAEWTELTSLEELAAMDDGPSTFFVGGYSTCKHLGDAIEHVRYKEDIVVVFPGVYTAAYSHNEGTAATAAGESGGGGLELNEAQLGGLRIYSVPYARSHAGASSPAEPKYAAPSKRRVGPWFTWLTAAATAHMLTQDGGGAGEEMEDGGYLGPHQAARAANPLKAAAVRAVAATETHSTGGGGGKTAASAASAGATTTTSGASVFAPVITATTADAAAYPVFDFAISVVYNDGEEGGGGNGSSGGLPHYKQEAGEDDAAEDGEGDEDGDDGNDLNNNNNTANDLEEEEEDEATSGVHGGRAAGGNTAVARRERAITLAGCCARGGIVLGALTRTVVTHCVLGTPLPAATPSLRIALTAASLTEALVEHCLLFGGSAYGLYAFPRAALTLESCLVEGPNLEAARVCGGGPAGKAAASYQSHGGGGQGGSVIELLEHRRARAERLRAFLQRSEDADNAMGGDGDGGTVGSVYVDAEDGVLPRFVVPPAVSTCEVAIMCDDADVRLTDCLISHARLGLLLHGGCAGTTVRGLDIRSCAEVGLYLYGLGGAAAVLNSAVRACGRACCLLVGPSAAEVAQAAAAHEAAADDADEDDHADGEEGGHRPVFAQHPHVKSNTFVGSVRVQGEVRSGAVVDNFVFLPREEKSAAAVATAAQTLLSVDPAARRGFTYVGVEGDRVTGRTAGQVAAV